MSELIGTPWVVKVGGAELRPGPALGELVLAIGRASRRARPVVVVHGGGEEVTERSRALGLPTTKQRGQRVTDDRTLEVVVEVLAGRVNARLVNALQGAGVPAVGVSGASARLLPVVPRPALGWVGEPLPARPRLLTTLLREGWTPVVAPLGTDGAAVYNVNADLAAAAIAGALRADLAIVTDVAGVLDERGAPIPSLSVGDARRLVARGTARDGMVPKLAAAELALVRGAASAWLGPLEGLHQEREGPEVGTRVVPGRRSSIPVLPSPLGGGR